MTGRILVVDDVALNRQLLEAKLTLEYYDVTCAGSGPAALERIAAEQPDLVLLDVMMPDMDGYEVCRRIKANPDTAYIPVIMVTALDNTEDRVTGLEAGADDFLTKPVNDLALFARVKNLVRLKHMTDEWRNRQIAGERMGVVSRFSPEALDDSPAASRILTVTDELPLAAQIAETIGPCQLFDTHAEPASVLEAAVQGDFDVILVSLDMRDADGLRLVAQLRSAERTRQTPILVLVHKDDQARLARALDIGANDYLLRPLEKSELTTRIKSQIRRKRYDDRLRNNLQLTLEMAIKDQLTGLFNRRYMETQLSHHVSRSADSGGALSVMIIDVDHFKSINDTHGHDVGDDVLRDVAQRIRTNVRGIDLVCRLGGEEFIVVMPDTELRFAEMVAERLRQQIADVPFATLNAPGCLEATISIGVSALNGRWDTMEALLRRADQALYRAKEGGRNRVVCASQANAA